MENIKKAFEFLEIVEDYITTEDLSEGKQLIRKLLENHRDGVAKEQSDALQTLAKMVSLGNIEMFDVLLSGLSMRYKGRIPQNINEVLDDLETRLKY
jgi:hypothetical protein